MDQPARDISFRKATAADTGSVSQLICLAFSGAVLSLYGMIDEEVTMTDCIAAMLNLNIGHAKIENCFVAVSERDIVGMVFTFPASRFRYEDCGLSESMKNGMAGFFNPDFGDPSMHYIHSFAVLPEFQNRKIGRTLLSMAKDRARREGSRSMIVGTSESNPASHRTYEAAGFRVAGSELMTGMDILECSLNTV